MAGNPSRKKGKKNRKHGRNKKFCEWYSKTGQKAKNKATKLRKHLKEFPNDAAAQEALKKLG